MRLGKNALASLGAFAAGVGLVYLIQFMLVQPYSTPLPQRQVIRTGVAIARADIANDGVKISKLSDEATTKTTTSELTTEPPVTTEHVTVKTPEAKRILLVTYMRGGSTFLGEIFNQNPHAFVWFEPMDGVYSSMYGSNFGWHPPDIFFDDKLNLREIPEFEKEGLLSALANIFGCHIRELPTQVSTHSFFYYIKTVLNNRDYQQCLGQRNSWSCVSAFAKKMCKTRMFPAPDSPNTPEQLTLPECHELVQDLNLNNPLNPHMEKLYARAYNSSHDAGKNLPSKSKFFDDLFQTMKTFSKCMESIKEKGAQCFPKLHAPCAAASVRVIKTIRLRMRTCREMMERDPGLHAVIMFRDPRGVIASRFQANFVSRNSHGSKIREATMLCRRMEEDYRFYEEMKKDANFNSRLMMLRYESIANEPGAVAKSVYSDLLGQAVPEQVYAWLNSSVGAETDNGKMGTVRKNGTQTANKWMGSLKAGEIEAISEICRTVLEKLEYPIDVL